MCGRAAHGDVCGSRTELCAEARLAKLRLRRGVPRTSRSAPRCEYNSPNGTDTAISRHRCSGTCMDRREVKYTMFEREENVAESVEDQSSTYNDVLSKNAGSRVQGLSRRLQRKRRRILSEASAAAVVHGTCPAA